MVSRADPIELLLPDHGRDAQAHARRVVTVLRLLADDARSARASSVQVDLPRARAELLADAHARLRGALQELLAAHVASAIGPGTFGAALLPAADWARAWSVLDAWRSERDGLPAPPAPDESALSVATRLFDGLERVDAALDAGPLAERAASERGLWRAQLARAERGPRAAERALRALLDRARGRSGEAAGTDDACAAAVAMIACLLDRGAVREAAALLGELGDGAARDARLARLAGWVALLSGDEPAARASAQRLGVWREALPRALCELRAAVPAWLPCLTGREPAAGAAAAAALALPVDRSSIGAALACTFAFRAGAGAQAVHVDAAPAWRARVPEWLDERRDACALAGEREHRVIVRGAAVVEHALGGAPLCGVLGGAATRAVAVVPISARDPQAPRDGELFADDEQELSGWLHLEFEHHLVPPAAALALLARGARARLDARPPRRAADAAARAGAPDDEGSADAERAGDDPRAEVFARLVEALGVKTSVRRWWGYELDGEALVQRAHGGGSRALSGRAAGGRLALQRARAAGGGVVFDEPDARLAVHERSASGMVVPLRLPGVGGRAGARLAGLLALESERRRDFREADLERFADLGQRFALELWLAGFRGWHRARFGTDLCFDAELERPRAEQLFALARSRAPVAIVGPAGAGKTVLARELHYASACLGAVDADDLVEIVADPLRDALGPALERAPGGTLLIEEVEGLSEAAQLQLARALDARAADGARATRIVATSRVDPCTPAGSPDAPGARLVDALARRLDRLRLWVPPLCERRNEIPPLVSFLAARFAAEEGLARVRPSDEAIALLWRQPWLGNLRELEGLVHKLALLHAGTAIGPDEVLASARRFRLELVPRVSSRRPDHALVRAALDATRTGGGRVNKTRAALYLGWDPDTLVARLDELDLERDAVGAEPGRGEPPADHEGLAG